MHRNVLLVGNLDAAYLGVRTVSEELSPGVVRLLCAMSKDPDRE
jgi:hypothetical protein